MILLYFVLLFSEKTFGTLGAGGPISDLQANMDVKHLYLQLKMDPTHKTIEGKAEWDVVLRNPQLRKLEWDLYSGLVVSHVTSEQQNLDFKQDGHKVFITLPDQPSPKISVRIHYAGQPFEAINPPWQGGFTWVKTDQGSPWVAVSCQGEGAKVWFPAKDQIGDKIEGFRLEFTVPEGLVCAANGRLIETTQPQPGWTQFTWVSDYSVNPYNISFGLGDYGLQEDLFKDRENRETPVAFYYLKHHQKSDQITGDTRSFQQKRDDLVQEFMRYLDFYARHFGPFPFQQDKAGIVQTPYLGMEHQTINAYGNHFKMVDGYDWLLLHELGHEWWGNKVSVADWRDFWIHEGICTYSTAMFLEETKGIEGAFTFLTGLRKQISNAKPIVGPPQSTTSESYSLDVYYKGALMLHSLRFLLGKAALDDILKTFATSPATTYLSAVTTEDFISLTERISEQDLRWFFDRYLYQAELPSLSVTKKGKNLHLAWDSEAFPMPIEIQLKHKGKTTFHRIKMPRGKGTLALPKNASYSVDPRSWVLKSNPP